RGLRRREPALLTPPAQRLQDLLGLTDEELVRTLDASALELLAGALDHRPELQILLDLLADAEERASPAVLARWVRAGGRHGTPVDLLTHQDFAAFEDALDDLAERGFVLRAR
ncbi:MAG: hypothetical protein ACR2NB_11690, partial [Solirubrobacteraceae bacterium]